MDWFPALVATVAALVSGGEVRWAGVLGGLDDVRAEAFASSDPRLLDRVYAPGSSARDADTALIRGYRLRGAHVVGADLVVLSSKILRTSADQVVLDVVDRLAAAHVVWEDGTTRALPRDLPTRRIVTLVLTPLGWRIEN